MNEEKPASVTIRLTASERENLEKVAYENGRTISGEIRFRLRKQREQENARISETTN